MAQYFQQKKRIFAERNNAKDAQWLSKRKSITVLQTYRIFNPLYSRLSVVLNRMERLFHKTDAIR